MPFTQTSYGDVLRPISGLLVAWHDTASHEERQFLLNFNNVLNAVWRVADLPGLKPSAPGRFEQMLAVGAAECAVLALIADDSGYMVSRGPDGIHVATVVLAGRDAEATASAHTGGLAVSGAILLGLTDTSSAQSQAAAAPTSH